MTARYSDVVETARTYYNSEDADNFYFRVWGGEDIHIGIYEKPDEPIRDASRRTIERMASLASMPGAGGRVLDMGSGYGGAARHLARSFGCHVTALNLSEIENARAREMNLAQGLNTLIDVIDGSFEDVPLPDGACDVVWSQDAILHSGRRDRVVAEAARVLRPGGTLILTDPMQADDCPEGVLQPVLDRIHLSSLGSVRFYRDQAASKGLREVQVLEMPVQLTHHYLRIRQELESQREHLLGSISEDYMDRMLAGLGHWIDAGRAGHLNWGILHFRKPAT